MYLSQLKKLIHVFWIQPVPVKDMNTIFFQFPCDIMETDKPYSEGWEGQKENTATTKGKHDE